MLNTHPTGESAQDAAEESEMECPGESAHVTDDEPQEQPNTHVVQLESIPVGTRDC